MLSLLNQTVMGPMLPILLLCSGVYFSLKLRFFSILHPIRCLRGLFGGGEAGRGSASASFRSMFTALAGTLGVGNITGVACAITAGGAGAVFWMWISAFCVMLVKYAEIVLACRYRVRGNDGEIHGGAPYYMRDGLKRPHLSRIFSLLLLFSSFAVGNMTQTSAASETAAAFFGVPHIVSGILLTLILAFLISGGGKRIADFASRLIPPLSAGYVILSLIVIVRGSAMLPSVFSEILSDAFTPRAGVCGIFGYLTMPSLRLGTARGIFSNEAGCGTAPTAHAASNAPPSEQGLFGIFEVFVDTILLCTMTALVVLLSYKGLSDCDGTTLAIRCFSAVLGEGAQWFLALSVILYALASTVAWAFYGMEALRFLGMKKTADKCYRLFYSLACLPGAICPMGLVWEMADFTVCLMTLINVLCLLALSRQVKEETDLYFVKKRRRCN